MTKIFIHNNNNVNVCGTSLKGHITASYSRLVEVFGEPVECDGYKVSGEWVFEDSEGNVFTLYDWKSTELYDTGLPTVNEFRQLSSATFNVGGNAHAGEFIDWLENQLKVS